MPPDNTPRADMLAGSIEKYHRLRGLTGEIPLAIFAKGDFPFVFCNLGERCGLASKCNLLRWCFHSVFFGGVLRPGPKSFHFHNPFFPDDCAVFVFIASHEQAGFQKLRGARPFAMPYAAKQGMRGPLKPGPFAGRVRVYFMGLPPSFFADYGQIAALEFFQVIVEGWCLHGVFSGLWCCL